MKTVNTSHAVLLSADKKFFYGEKNVRFNHNITFFWWKLENWDTFDTWLIRELLEETWVNFKNTDKILLENKQSVVIWNINFIWNLYLIYVTKNQIETILGQKHGRNIEISTKEIDSINFWFPELKDKLLLALNN